MAKYRKKPVVIDAFKWEPGTCFPAPEFNELHAVAKVIGDDSTPENHYLQIHTLEGRMRCDPGHWIIKGIAGEFYPVDPDIFEKTYDRE